MIKVLGLGNALVDIMLPNTNEQVLVDLQLPKGSMTLIDDATLQRIVSATADAKKIKATGGSAANTINGLAKLGIGTGFIAKTGKDVIGSFFESDLINNGVASHVLRSDTPAGRAYAFVTADSERTFATYLGASIELKPQEIKPSSFDGYGYLYVEGYLVQDHHLIEQGMKLAQQAGLKIVLDLASYNVVEANKAFLTYLTKTYVDIVFANEEEALALTGLAPDEALGILSTYCEIAVVKVGAKGSLIKAGHQMVAVEPIKANPIDTTGAGDLYAAGFLYGLLNGYTLPGCGEAASLLSGNVIEVFGAKMEEKRWNAIKAKLSTFSVKYH